MNNDETKKVTIVREHDKLCFLEQLLNNDAELEHLVSEYIDLCIHNQPKTNCFLKIKDKINNIITLAKIIRFCSSIAYDKPIDLEIPKNNYEHISKYLNEPYIPLFF